MPLTPYADYSRLLNLLRQCPVDPLDKTVFRAVASVYAGDHHLLTGEGSLRNGGRWNPPGLFRVVYASFDDHTALAESNAKFHSYGFTKPERRTIVPLRVTLSRTVSINALAELLGVLVPDLLTVDWLSSQNAGQEPLTQAIGRAANELQLQALLSPSAQYTTGTNIVLLRDRIRIPEEMEILDPAPASGL